MTVDNEFLEEYSELLEDIQKNSMYKLLPSRQKKWMTVKEMGDLLGLKKTDRYWLIHKNAFETQVLHGMMRVNIESFEKWYANQIKYHKVTGEEPGQELKQWSYSLQDIAKLLDISEDTVYAIFKRDKIPTFEVDYWRRVSKEEFEKWYRSQNRYQTKEDRARDAKLLESTISMPEMARLLGVDKRCVYGILRNKKYADIFEYVYIAEKKRISKESFQIFLSAQSYYKLTPINDYKEIAFEKNPVLAELRRKKLIEDGKRHQNGNQNYLTFEEACAIAKLSRPTLYYYMNRNCFSSVKFGSVVRVKRDEFEAWLQRRSLEGAV